MSWKSPIAVSMPVIDMSGLGVACSVDVNKGQEESTMARTQAGRRRSELKRDQNRMRAERWNPDKPGRDIDAYAVIAGPQSRVLLERFSSAISRLPISNALAPVRVLGREHRRGHMHAPSEITAAPLRRLFPPKQQSLSIPKSPRPTTPRPRASRDRQAT
jgi:hypothetical protein